MNTKPTSNTSPHGQISGKSELSPSSNPSPVGHSELESSFVKERLRQARRGFDLAWVTTAVCSFVGIGGVVLMLTGQSIPGSAATAGGLGATVYCLRLAKDANDRLDKAAKEMQDD